MLRVHRSTFGYRLSQKEYSGKVLQTQPPRSRQRRAPPLPPPPKKGRGMQIRPHLSSELGMII